MLQAAIVGLGWWGRTLVQAVQGKSQEIRFIAGATGRRARAEDFAREAGLDLVDRYEDLLADPGIEAVVLATPHLDHEAQVIAAARAGKHVFVEKPFALEKASAERAVAAARESGIVLGLGHNRRFHPNMGILRERVRTGSLGTILHCEGTMTSPSGLFLKQDSWRTDPHQSPAGGMAGLGIHMVDGMIDVIGPVSKVCCQSVHRAVPSGAQDTTSILLRFENGVTGFVSCMTATAPFYRFTVYGTKGIAEITTPSLDHFNLYPAPQAHPSTDPTRRPVERHYAPAVDTVRLELEAFAEAIRGGTPFPITPAEMAHGSAVFEAVTRSSAECSWVSVP